MDYKQNYISEDLVCSTRKWRLIQLQSEEQRANNQLCMEIHLHMHAHTHAHCTHRSVSTRIEERGGEVTGLFPGFYTDRGGGGVVYI